MNFKKILLGSAIAAASFGLYACGDDSSSPDTPVNPDNPGAQIIDQPKASSLSPIIFDNLKITPMSNGAGGMRGSLSGMVKLDPEFLNPEVPYTAEAVTMIDSVDFAVGKVVNGQSFEEGKITINLDGVVFPAERVPFSQKFFEFSELSGCGDFKLYVFVYSSTKETDLETSNYVSIDSIAFTRSEQECQAPIVESSSSAAVVCTPVTANDLSLSNSMGTSQSAVNFETGLADNPHISVRFANNAAYITPGTGVTVYEDQSQTTGLLPTKNPVCSEDFRKSNFQFEDELTSGVWLDVVTADGKMYPVMVKKAMFESATKGTVDIVYYK